MLQEMTSATMNDGVVAALLPYDFLVSLYADHAYVRLCFREVGGLVFHWSLLSWRLGLLVGMCCDIIGCKMSNSQAKVLALVRTGAPDPSQFR